MDKNPIEMLKQEVDGVAINTLIPDEEFLSSISYRSIKFSKSLKQLRVLDISIEDVLEDLMGFQKKINDSSTVDRYSPYRVKARQSLMLKYNKYLNVNGNFLTCFNDLLGFRVKVGVYPSFDKLPTYFRVVDLTTGKEDDDGYRAVHLYYKKIILVIRLKYSYGLLMIGITMSGLIDMCINTILALLVKS